MSHDFDDFSKRIAGDSMPRRESLKQLGFALAATILAPLGAQYAQAGKHPKSPQPPRAPTVRARHSVPAATRSSGTSVSRCAKLAAVTRQGSPAAAGTTPAVERTWRRAETTAQIWRMTTTTAAHAGTCVRNREPTSTAPASTENACMHASKALVIARAFARLSIQTPITAAPVEMSVLRRRHTAIRASVSSIRARLG
jgi:hypothetical protein